MIYVNMHGRLGNQLFQYAFAKKIQLERKDKIVINFDNGFKNKEKENGWEDSLQYFNVSEYITENDKKSFMVTKSNFIQKIIGGFYALSYKKYNSNEHSFKRMDIQKKWQPILNRFGIYWIVQGYFPFKVSKSKNVIINGHFEECSFYDEAKLKSILQKEFTPKQEPLLQNKKLYEIINGKNSVCVSIRRGDFLNDDNCSFYNVCTLSYYTEAINKMREMTKNPVFIMFSDDLNWVKENFPSCGDILYETDNNPVWEKLRLMYSCKNFIISNSTFSWWAQYLSANDDKIVISPSKWVKDGSYKGLIDEKFITIEV